MTGKATKFSWRIGPYVFAPRLVPTLATVILFPCFIALGFWQLDRADQKRDLQHQYENNLKQAPMDLNALSNDEIQQIAPFQAFEATGQFDNKHVILLDNQFHQHQVGYYVYTPFILSHNKAAILVNRGWVAQGANRAQLPTIENIEGTLAIQGFSYQPSKPLILSNEKETFKSWPIRVQSINIGALAELTDLSLMPKVLYLSPQHALGFKTDWQVINTNPAKHQAYAVQWFIFASILIGLFVYLNLSKEQDHE